MVDRSCYFSPETSGRSVRVPEMSGHEVRMLRERGGATFPHHAFHHPYCTKPTNQTSHIGPRARNIYPLMRKVNSSQSASRRQSVDGAPQHGPQSAKTIARPCRVPQPHTTRHNRAWILPIQHQDRQPETLTAPRTGSALLVFNGSHDLDAED